MPRFTVYASETVYYRFNVDADSLDEARNKVYDGEADIGEPTDSYDFEISDIEQLDELVTWYSDGVKQMDKESNNA